MENDQANENISLEDSARAVMQDLPDPIRRFIVSGGVETMTGSIVSKHNLRVDQGTVIEREMLLMLIGAHEPSALLQTLQQDAGMDSQTASAVLQDVNTLVFNPIHQEMTKMGAGEPTAADETMQSATNTPGPTPPDQPTNGSPSTNNVAQSQPVTPVSTVQQPEQPASQPQPQIPPTSAETPVAPPPPPAPTANAPRPPESPPIPLTPKTPHVGTPLVNEYAVDPYREPVDGEEQ